MEMSTAVSIRHALPDDLAGIRSLYLAVTLQGTGIARGTAEITHEYIGGFITKSLACGIILVAVDGATKEVVAEVHTYHLGPAVFDHVLGELTIVVRPDFQQYGIGRRLFKTLLQEVEDNYPGILRVELVSKESNVKALRFYESLGFVREGRFEQRIVSDAGGYEADIPMAWFNPRFKRQ